jgi:sialic acid synthase SpsE
MVFITAEIGVNWDGNFELVEKMMLDAKNSNCDAVKFQAFNEKMVKDHPEKNRLLKTSISKENIEQINSISKKIGIEWYCTPMYEEAIDFLDPFVNRYKIRYGDSLDLHNKINSKLISKVLETGKQTIISSQKSPKNLQNYDNVKWLYVVPKYPCPIDELDFSHLSDFDGYSNHCLDYLAPLSAAILGASMIEIHVTSDKNKNFIDNQVSFNPEEVTMLVDLIRRSQKLQR